MDRLRVITITYTININPNVYFKNMTVLDKALLDILVCPVSKKPLEYDKETKELVSAEAGLAYPVKDGIPVMLPEEARKL
jgi:uncharacterized protein YbaR (Trm112 family)